MEINDILAKDVKHIEIAGTGHGIYNREAVANYVELPLLNACLNFYDKNIRTIFNDTGGKNNEDSIIEIDYDSLDENNKKVADKLITSGKASFHNYCDGAKGVILTIPTKETTKVSELDKISTELAEMFFYQDILFGKSTIKQMIIRVCGPNKQEILDEFFPEGMSDEETVKIIIDSGIFPNIFFDKEENIFWDHENFFLRHKLYLESKKANNII